MSMSEQKKGMITLGVLLLIVVVVGLYTYTNFTRSQNFDSSSSEASRTLAVPGGATAAYTTLDGEPLDLSQYSGKVRVVNSWASWCPFCVKELGEFNDLGNEYADKNVVVIAINRKENPVTITNFLNNIKPLNNIVFALDPVDTFYDQIGGITMPETVFYDKTGNVVFHKRGFMNLEEMRTHTENALSERSDE